MILTFKDLQDRVLRMLDETAEGSPTTLALAKDFLNSAHYQRCMEFPWGFMLWPQESTITTAASQRLYALHEEFGRPLYFKNGSTKEFLEEVPVRGLPEDNMDWNNDTGDAWHFYYAGMQPISKQPSSATTVTIVSNSTSDTGSTYAVTIHGENSDGHLVSETLSPTGTTSVASTTSFSNIIDVVKATSWTGTLTMTISGSTVLTLLPAQFAKQYKTIHLIELPAAGQEIKYRFYRQPRVLSADQDVPNIPAPWSEVLVWDALLMMAGYLTSASPQSVELWGMRRAEAEKSLYQALANDGLTLEARPHYVRYMDAGRDDPRLFRD
jgi:hypothetical protein